MDHLPSDMVGKSEGDFILRSPSDTSRQYPNVGAGTGARLQPRRSKRVVPTDEKDDKYWEKRKRNNEAARRSRETKRQADMDVKGHAVILEEQNALLQKELQVLKSKFGLPFNRRFTGVDKNGELVSEPMAVSMPPGNFNGNYPTSPHSMGSRIPLGYKEEAFGSPSHPRYDPQFDRKGMEEMERIHEGHQNGKMATPVKGSPPPYYPHPAYPYAGSFWTSPPDAHSQSQILSSPVHGRTGHYPMAASSGMEQHMSSVGEAYAQGSGHHGGPHQDFHDNPSRSGNPAHCHSNSSPVNNHPHPSYNSYYSSLYHAHMPDKILGGHPESSHGMAPADLSNKQAGMNAHYQDSESSRDGMNSIPREQEHRQIDPKACRKLLGVMPDSLNDVPSLQDDMLRENYEIRNRIRQLSEEAAKMKDFIKEDMSHHHTQSKSDN